MQVIGDSTIVIDWLKGYNLLKTSLLDQQMNKFIGLIKIFGVISFYHIHSELNSKAKRLYKMGVGLQLGEIYYGKYL